MEKSSPGDKTEENQQSQEKPPERILPSARADGLPGEKLLFSERMIPESSSARTEEKRPSGWKSVRADLMRFWDLCASVRASFLGFS